MSEFISILFAIFIYFVLFKLLFENVDEFIEKLKSTLFIFPIAAITDYVSSKESLRIYIWLPSGILAGVGLYQLLKQTGN